MNKVWTSLAALAVAGLVFQAGVNAGGDDKGLTGKDIAGTYRIVSGEKDGEKIPAKDVEGSMVRFTGDRIVATDKDKKDTYSATYKLDGQKLTMSSVHPVKGITTHGMVKKEGTQLHLIYALPDEKTKEVGKAPTDFKTQKNQLMVILEKVKE